MGSELTECGRPTRRYRCRHARTESARKHGDGIELWAVQEDLVQTIKIHQYHPARRLRTILERRRRRRREEGEGEEEGEEEDKEEERKKKKK